MNRRTSYVHALFAVDLSAPREAVRALAFVALLLGGASMIAQPAPTIDTFTASPSTIASGGTSTLTWTTSNATSATLSDGSLTLTVNVDHSLLVSPSATTTYTLTAKNAANVSVTSTKTVTVVRPPKINSFSANPPTIRAGETSTLSWSTTDAASTSIDNGVGSVSRSGSTPVTPLATTTYTLTATNSLGAKVTDTVTVTVTAAGKLQILLPGELPAPGTPSGKSGAPLPQIAGRRFNVLVRIVDDDWNPLSSATDTVRIASSDISAVLPSPASAIAGVAVLTVTLNTTGSQTLSVSDVSDPGKEPSTSAPVLVRGAADAVIAVASFPSGMVAEPQTGGQTDRFVLVNTGDTAAVVSLTQDGSFFTQSPATFTLPAGASQTVEIVATAQAAGSYRGASIVSGEGVPSGLSIPITLLVAAPPPGRPDVRPALIRIDTNEAVNGGSAEFRNVGDATANGYFVSDVPWLIPQSAPLSIEPGHSATGTFTIDRTRRADAEHSFGAQTARLTFVYLTRSGDSAHSVRSDDSSTPPASSLVTLVDTVGVNGAAAPIPALAPGQVARFVVGLARKAGQIADVSFLNASAASLSDFRFYFVPSGRPSTAAKVAAISQLSPNFPVGLGDLLGSVFKESSASGSVQFRTRLADPFALRAILLNPSTAGMLGTSLSVLRSDTGASAGQDLVLTGIRKDGNTRTDLFLQETSGASASAQIQFFDAAGTELAAGRLPDALSPFQQLELTDVAPPGAVMARITNRASSAGRLAAEAQVIEAGGDVWNVVDSARQSGFTRSEPVLIPFAASTAPPTSYRTELVITNTSKNAGSAVITGPPSSGRRRSVRADAVGGGAAKQQTISLAAGETRVLPDILRTSAGLTAGYGYVTFTPTAGEFVVTSRTARDADSGTIGSSVPAIGVSRAMQKGSRRSLSGLEDASADNVAQRVPGTYRSAVGLVETSGADATVRVTLQYTFPQSGFSSIAEGTATYALHAHQFMMIDPLASAILGPAREQLDDLANLQLTVEVTDGTGAVVPFAVSTENGTGDIFFTPIE